MWGRTNVRVQDDAFSVLKSLPSGVPIFAIHAEVLLTLIPRPLSLEAGLRFSGKKILQYSMVSWVSASIWASLGVFVRSRCPG